MNYRTIFIALLAAASVSCSKPAPEPTKVAGPKLVSTKPADGTTDVSLSAMSVVFTYDQNIKCPLENKSKITISPSATIVSIGSYGTDLTISIDGLEGETTYTVTVPAETVLGFKSNQDGAAAASIKFTTKAAPVVIPPVDPDVLPTKGSSIAWQMADKIGAGWNLGNQMDASVNDVANETCWGNPKCTQATFTALKEAGFKTVRVPITWMGHIGAAPEYTVEKAWMDRVAEIVGYAEKAGLNCIINTHHDENHDQSAAHWQDIKAAVGDAKKNAEIRAEIKALWGQIAEKFKNKGEWLIFEGFNEINDGGWGWSDAFKANPQAQYDILNDWNQDFVDAVRATGGNNATRWLGIAGYAANPTFTMNGLVLPKDSAENRLMVAVHCYDPASFCGAGTTGIYEEWGHTGVTKPTDDERSLRTTMAKLYAAYVERGIPCYFGECGCVNKTSEKGIKFQKYYLEYFSKAADSYGIPCIIWDNGIGSSKDNEAFGYINHGTGAYIENGSTVIPGFIKGQNDTSTSYTLDKVYSSAPSVN